MIGKSLAHYEVLDLIGKGGMGEVYRARDTHLEREVALKILPLSLSSDPERVARFEREARTLATLQHPNIASIYGFEEDAGVRFLVMELVAGEDLAARMQHGRIPTDEVIAIARQIAEGLEAAHERGIVHRDLKPANIKITPEGKVKILDFGLARAYSSDSEDEGNIANSPTITAAMTQAGTILGTAAYMSPEQAKGKSIDKRADIWAFGVILYEMLSGKPLFQAETISETLASVLLREIVWEELPNDTPPSLRSLMRRCLHKDAQLRLRDIGEARIALDDNETMLQPIGATDSAKGGASGLVKLWPWMLAIMLTFGVGFLGSRLLTAPPADTGLPPLMFDIPDDIGRLVTGSLALSPNGTHLIYARRDSLGGQDLWIRRLDEDESRLLRGTHGGRQPFWSSDGKNIGFFIQDGVYRTTLDGNAASKVATIHESPMGGTWNQRDIILVGTKEGPIYRVPANGEGIEAITTVIEGEENNHCWPAFLPDGQHFVFLADASSDDGHRLYECSLDGKEKKILEKNIRSAIFVDPKGALLWSHDSQLFARPFDFSHREFTGPRRLVQEQIQPFGDDHECALTVSANGLLAFQSDSGETVIEQHMLDGSAQKQLLATERYRNPRISPDGNLLAFEDQVSSDERLIWIHDLNRGTRTLISERGRMADSPTWSADGEFLYYDTLEDSGGWGAYRKKVNGGHAAESLAVPEGLNDLAVMDCSADGNWILVGGRSASQSTELYLGSLGKETLEWTLLHEDSSLYSFARFSPDSRWFAFESNASGQTEVYVSPVKGGPKLKQLTVSVSGGSDPSWTHDGGKLYYRSLTGNLMVSKVKDTSDGIEFSSPSPVMPLPSPHVGYLRNAYDLSPDGLSLVSIAESGGYNPAIRVRTGWRSW